MHINLSEPTKVLVSMVYPEKLCISGILSFSNILVISLSFIKGASYFWSPVDSHLVPRLSIYVFLGAVFLQIWRNGGTI